MIVKFFPHGNTSQGKTGRTSGGNAVRDYLLGKDKNREQATLIKGNPDQTTEIINGIKNKSIYTSGVLSFAESEKPTEKELEEIINSFENTMFPNMDKDQYSGYWVKHGDKDRTELHFVFANVELKTGKALPVYYHKNDKNLVDSWKNLTNDKYKLLDPNAPINRKQLTTTTRNERDNEQKCGIHDRILSAVEQDKTVNSREDVARTIESLGYKITRQSKKDNTISIENPQGGRNLKLKGELYSPNFSRDKLPNRQEYAQQVYDSNRDKRISEQKTKYESHLASRENRLNKRFGDIDRTPLDNQLTKDLAEIRAENEPNFYKSVLNDKAVSEPKPPAIEQTSEPKTPKFDFKAMRERLEQRQQAEPKPPATQQTQGVTFQELQSYKAELNKNVYENLNKLPPAKFEISVKDFENKAKAIEQKAQQSGVSEQEFKNYAMYKDIIFTSEKIKLERAEQQKTADNERPATPPQPKTLKELLQLMTKEQRQELTKSNRAVVTSFQNATNKLAVELYHHATPPNQREKPLFEHYKEHDLKAVQPYKVEAKQQIFRENPTLSKELEIANNTLEILKDIEQNEQLEQRAEQMKQERELGNDRGK